MDVDSTDNIREVWVLLLQLLYKTTQSTVTPHAELKTLNKNFVMIVTIICVVTIIQLHCMGKILYT